MQQQSCSRRKLVGDPFPCCWGAHEPASHFKRAKAQRGIFVLEIPKRKVCPDSLPVPRGPSSAASPLLSSPPFLFLLPFFCWYPLSPKTGLLFPPIPCGSSSPLRNPLWFSLRFSFSTIISATSAPSGTHPEEKLCPSPLFQTLPLAFL